MKEVLEFIVKSLVSNKEAVVVTEQERGKNINFVVEVDDKDVGSVIGRAGAIANSIRTVVQAVNPTRNRISIKFNGKSKN